MRSEPPAADALPGLDRLPFTLAAPVRAALDEPAPFRRLHLLVHAFSQAVRFVALCNVCDYIRAARLHHPSIDASLGALRRPSLGPWLQVAREVGAAFERAGEPLFLEEWPAALDALQGRRHPGCVIRDPYGPTAELGALDAFLQLRNVLAHGGIPPDDAVCAALAARYDPILRDLLHTLAFLQDVVVYRPLRRVDGGVEALPLRGPGSAFQARRVACAPESPLAGYTACFVGRESAPERWLPLDPLFISRVAEEGDGFAEPLLSSEGLGSRTVYYMGLRQKVEARDRFDAVVAALFVRPRRGADPGGPVAARALQATLETLTAYHGARYHPEVYQERQRFNTLLDDFSHEMPDRVSGLLLAAESGAGKTSLLCHTAARWMTEEDARAVPLLLAARHLPGGADGVGAAVRAVLGADPAAPWPQALRAAEEALPPAFRRGERRLVLMVDGLNEAADPLRALRELDEVVAAARRVPWLRCVGTVRRGAFDVLLPRLEARPGGWPRAPRAYVRTTDEAGRLSVGIGMDGFSGAEAREAYTRYLARAAAHADVPACRTPYDQLPAELRPLVSHPLLMRMLMQAFDGQPVPANVAPLTLFERFHHETLSPLQARTAEALALACRRAGRARVPDDAVAAIAAGWRAERADYELLVSLDPVEQLVDVGVLLRGADGHAFVHQLYFEYLLVRTLAAERAGTDRLRLDLCCEVGYKAFFVGDSLRSTEAYQKALRILERIRPALGGDGYDLVKRNILGGRGCAEHNLDDNEACLASHAEALRIDRRLNDRGAVALDLVNLADAHWGCHQLGNALRLYRDAVDTATRACFEDARDIALIGQGIAQWSVGRLDEAEESLSAGLELAERLDYDWDRAYGYLYQANLLASRGRLRDALALNARAMEMAEGIAADYLVGLGASYGCWMREVARPGDPANEGRIADALAACRARGMRGPALFLESVRVLHRLARRDVDDAPVAEEMAELLGTVRGAAPVKGPWELLGYQLLGAAKRFRRGVDVLDLQDTIDEMCERKASTLPAEDAEVFLATRRAWKRG
jgi:tetratricopeptide (TPR) repeat protein